MKEITTKSGKLLLVKDCPGIYEIVKHTTKLKILGKFSELRDEDFKEFVLQWGQDMSKDIINSVVLGFSDIIKVDENGLYYKDYLDNINNNYTLTVKESFQSLVKSQGLDGNLDNYLIIKVL